MKLLRGSYDSGTGCLLHKHSSVDKFHSLAPFTVFYEPHWLATAHVFSSSPRMMTTNSSSLVPFRVFEACAQPTVRDLLGEIREVIPYSHTFDIIRRLRLDETIQACFPCLLKDCAEGNRIGAQCLVEA